MNGMIKRNLVSALASMLALFLLAPHYAAAQGNAAVRGVVTNSEGIAISGATVMNLATGAGTTTDNSGRFSIETSLNATLTVSFMGMKTVSVPVSGRSEISITLEEEVMETDEVVVIGYGTVRKSDMTGSVASIRAEELEERTVTSLEDALRGRIAGVRVSSSDGQPGESISIRIRGTGSINASNAPLYVVDGVPMETLDVVPSEVATLEILKDASATAIYGSRGANGVVLVTTKQGTSREPEVNVWASTSFNKPVRLIEMMDAGQYYEHRAEGRAVFVPAGVQDNSSRVKFYDRDGNLWGYNPDNMWYLGHLNKEYGDIDTDWQRSMLRKSQTFDARVSVSGSDDNTRYALSGSYQKQEGSVLFSRFERYNGRLNLTQDIDRSLKVGVNISAARSKQNGAFTNEQYGTLYNMLGQQPVKALNFTDEFIDLGGESALYNNNPWYQAKYVERNVTRDNVQFKLHLDKTFLRDFRLNISGNLTMNNLFNDAYTPSTIRGAGYLAGGIATQTRRTLYDLLNENILYYKPAAKGIHRIDAMVGVTMQQNTTRINSQEVQNFDYQQLGSDGMSMGLKPFTPRHEVLTHRMVSFLGRANYFLIDKYLFTASIRADGSSRFGANHRWAYFPSGAFAWLISSEEFLAGNPVLTSAKLRISAGVSGNTDIPPYQTLPMLGISNYPFDGSEPSLGLEALRLANPDLKWETSTQYDAGLDLGFFGGHLNATVDIYYKRTRDLLLVEPTPGFTGHISTWSNTGKVDNRGLEISLGGQTPLSKHAAWESSLNIALNRSKVIYMGDSGQIILTAPGVPASNFGLLRQGEGIGLWYGYQTDGLFRSYDEIMSMPENYISLDKTREAIFPGAQRYVDQNGDGMINEADRIVLGNAEPKMLGGWLNTFTYRNFQLSINTEFRVGGDIFNATGLYFERGAGGDNMTRHYFENKFRPTLYDPETGEIVWQGNEDTATLPGTWLDSTAENVAKDTYIEDGSYLRISDISFSYNLPKKLTRKLSLQRARFTVSVKNPLLITGYSGYDPDVNSVGGANADLLPGLDNGSYPRTRSVLLNLNLTF